MANTTTSSRAMLDGPLFKSILFYTVPIILTGILQLLFNAADLVVVGRFCGEISVAAVGNAGTVTSLIVNLFIGLSVGTSVTVAHAIGANKADAVHRAVHTALPAAIVSGAIITVIGFAFSDALLRLMDTPESVLPLSSLYLNIYFVGMIFMMVYNFCSAILRAAGDTKSPLIFLTIAGVVNVVLNVIFVTLFDMNVAGVAWATTISQGVSAALVVLTLMRRTDACRLYLKKIRFYKAELLEMVRIGLPAGIQNCLFSISNVIIQSSINSFGDIFMSGNAAANNIDGFLYVTLNGFHQTALNFIGQNVGAGQYKRAKKVLWSCLGYVLVFGFVIGSVILLLGPSLLSIYVPNSPEAVQWGMVRLTCLCYPFLLGGLMDVSTGALRGMGASTSPMIISVLGICGLRILWIYTIFQIPAFHTPQCLYYSYAVSWGVTFLCQLAAFFLLYRRRTKEQATPLPLT